MGFHPTDTTRTALRSRGSRDDHGFAREALALRPSSVNLADRAVIMASASVCSLSLSVPGVVAWGGQPGSELPGSGNGRESAVAQGRL
jgi:hypothetical protein